MRKARSGRGTEDEPRKKSSEWLGCAASLTLESTVGVSRGGTPGGTEPPTESYHDRQDHRGCPRSVRALQVQGPLEGTRSPRDEAGLRDRARGGTGRGPRRHHEKDPRSPPRRGDAETRAPDPLPFEARGFLPPGRHAGNRRCVAAFRRAEAGGS